VPKSTPRHSDILDLGIYRYGPNPINNEFLSSTLLLISYKKNKSILANLDFSFLVLDQTDDIEFMVDLYINALAKLVDEHAPFWIMEIIRSLLP